MKGTLKNKIIATFLCALALTTSLTACKKDSDAEETKPASYGTYGAEFARELAVSYPGRKAYTNDESYAADLIKGEFEKLGYTVKEQEFTGTGGVSKNLIISIEGEGFIHVDEESGAESNVRRKAVIGAHYDSQFSDMDIPSDRTYDAISDNASGIGCLLTLAKNIKDAKGIGFDVDIVAFGASTDNYAGARAYYDSLSDSDKKSLEVMYCIENIYAGDKIYANSGFNSLKLDQKYKMRRKLYQAYDVAYNDMLYSLNNFNLNYNESGIVTDLNGDGVEDCYREVSLNKSDYVVFDENNIPIVFFDSGDYFFDKIDKMKETKNLNLQEFNGMISGTWLDSTTVLDAVLVTEDTDQLEVRINNVAYVIIGSLIKGSDYGMTIDEFREYKQRSKVTPTPAT